MKNFMIVAVVVGMLCFTTAGAQAAFVNGSFESGAINPGSYTTLFATDTSIDGWAVYKGSVDYIGNYWTAANGSRSIDLNGASPGAIAQSFTTVAGQAYKVTFAMAGNPDNDPDEKTLDAGVKNVYNGLDITGGGSFTFDITGKTKSDMGWDIKSFYFTATSNRTSLWFESTTTDPKFTIPDYYVNNSNPFGPALDNIEVNVVPIPSAAWLFGTGVVALIGLRRRSGKKS